MASQTARWAGHLFGGSLDALTRSRGRPHSVAAHPAAHTVPLWTRARLLRSIGLRDGFFAAFAVAGGSLLLASLGGGAISIDAAISAARKRQ